MAKTPSTKVCTDTAIEPSAEELAAFCGPELYTELTKSVLFTEFVLSRMQELGFDVPDDVPLHLSLDYHLVLLKLCIDEYIQKGWRLPTPEHSNIPLRESMI